MVGSVFCFDMLPPMDFHTDRCAPTDLLGRPACGEVHRFSSQELSKHNETRLRAQLTTSRMALHSSAQLCPAPACQRLPRVKAFMAKTKSGSSSSVPIHRILRVKNDTVPSKMQVLSAQLILPLQNNVLHLSIRLLNFERSNWVQTQHDLQSL